ncbi:MAG: hypothetical protein R3C59_28580 [Planctomycetaceae bacterium]
MQYPVPFSQRLPSTEWQPLPIVRIPGLTLWAWFRPNHLPAGVLISFPADVVPAEPAAFPFSLADLIVSVGASLHQFQAVSLFGTEWQPAAVYAPFLNHPIPAVIAGGRPEVSIGLLDEALMIPVPVAYPMDGHNYLPEADHSSGYSDFPNDAELYDDDGMPDDGDLTSGSMYDRIEASWKSSLQLERQMAGLRQKLASTLASLGKLDRDLGPDERLAAERDDRDAWQDARRWLRDLSAKCHREIKAFDIGMTSGAGKRNLMEQTFQQVIQPRLPCDDLETHRREFETYRKDMVNLQRAMQSAQQAATQNGTARAQRVLNTIGRKIRERRAKMREPIGGVNMDKSVRRKK